MRNERGAGETAQATHQGRAAQVTQDASRVSPVRQRLPTGRRGASRGLLIGVDIGGTNQTVAAARETGEALSIRRRRLQPGGAAADVLANVLAMIDEALAEAAPSAQDGAAAGGGRSAARRLLRVGVGFGGPVDAERGLVLRSHHVRGWDRFPLKQELERRLGVPVVLDNDANAAALGEALFGAGRGERHVLYVNIGTGIGGGLVLNGALFQGAHGLAGEIGHVTVDPDGPPCDCGKQGCLEAVASGRSVARRAREAAARDPARAARLVALAGGEVQAIDSPHVFAAAREGDGLAQALVRQTGDYVGLALAGAANLLDPSIVIIGGGLAETGDLLFDPVRDAFRRHLLPALPAAPVVPAALGYDAGVIGALALALSGRGEQ
jgi:glucokinase